MPPCCVHSFVLKGLREHFRPAEPGDLHQCETCHRWYLLDPTWREVAGPLPPPLKIDDSDA
jgi:hypothetical protein